MLVVPARTGAGASACFYRCGISLNPFSGSKSMHRLFFRASIAKALCFFAREGVLSRFGREFGDVGPDPAANPGGPASMIWRGTVGLLFSSTKPPETTQPIGQGIA